MFSCPSLLSQNLPPPSGFPSRLLGPHFEGQYPPIPPLIGRYWPSSSTRIPKARSGPLSPVCSLGWNEEMPEKLDSPRGKKGFFLSVRVFERDLAPLSTDVPHPLPQGPDGFCQFLGEVLYSSDWSQFPVKAPIHDDFPALVELQKISQTRNFNRHI